MGEVSVMTDSTVRTEDVQADSELCQKDVEKFVAQGVLDLAHYIERQGQHFPVEESRNLSKLFPHLPPWTLPRTASGDVLS